MDASIPTPNFIYLIFSTFYLTYRDLRAMVPYFTYLLTSYAPSAGLKLTIPESRITCSTD